MVSLAASFTSLGFSDIEWFSPLVWRKLPGLGCGLNGFEYGVHLPRQVGITSSFREVRGSGSRGSEGAGGEDAMCSVGVV